MPVRLEYGTSYDGTAVLNNQIILTHCRVGFQPRLPHPRANDVAPRRFGGLLHCGENEMSDSLGYSHIFWAFLKDGPSV